MNNVRFEEIVQLSPDAPVYSEDPDYYRVDVVQLKNDQPLATNITRIKVRYPGDDHNVKAIIGVSEGDALMTENQWVILPCPPYCEKDGNLLPVKNHDPFGTVEISFTDAQSLF